MPTEPRHVISIGPIDSPDLAFVGEAPGKEEEKRGLPFVGQSGFLLDQVLNRAGISRHECFITNVADVRPPNNNFGVFYHDKAKTKPTPKLMEMRGRLKSELNNVNPKVIVALGNEALKALTDEKGIKGWRGCMYETDLFGQPARILPTLHPASILRMYDDKPILELDVKKALRQARRPHTPQMTFTINPSFDEIMAWLEKKLSPVAFDIESIGPCTRSLGFAWSHTEAISIPLIWSGTHRWTSTEEQMILQALNTYLADPDVEKYLQNAPYDSSVMAKELGIHVDGISLDTMYAFHLLYPELPKGLGFLTSIYTDFPKYWGLPEQPHDEGNARYGCFDCCATFIAAQKIHKELVERHQINFYRDRTHPTIFSLTRMQNRGIRVDKQAKQEMRDKLFKEHEEALLALPKLVGYDLNPQSPKQVCELLYEEWKVPVHRNPKTKKPTADEDALCAIGRQFPLRAPVLECILRCRKLLKLISTYLDQKLDGDRARTSYGLAKTGRITSSQTIEGYGGNLQNIPRGDFRRIYIADDGKVIIKADLAQAEYRVFCWDACVMSQIERYDTDPLFDVHTHNASLIYEKEAEKIIKQERYDTKQVVYQVTYGAGPLTVSKKLNMDFHKCKFILERFKQVTPELQQWWRDIEDDLKTTRKLTNALGRQRIFFGRMDAATFREAYNWKCQSLVADIINQALNELDDLGHECLLQVHDELVLQCPDTPEDIYLTVEAVKRAMEQPIKFPGIEQKMTIPVEIAVGPNWHDVKEWEAGP